MIKRIAVVFFLLLLCVAFFISSNDYKYNALIPAGVYINDVNVGSLTKEEALDKFKKAVGEKYEEPIILTFNDSQWALKASDYLDVDVDKSMDNIIKYIHSESMIKRFILRQRLKKSPLREKPVIKYKDDKLQHTFDELNKAINIEPVDAAFEIRDDTISVISDIKGQFLDTDKLKEDIVEAFWSENRTLKIPTKNLRADRTKEDLAAMDIKVKVGEYSTKFNKALKGRTENIKIAAEKINGYILSPEDIFSFNTIVGERTEEKGYKEAPVFIDNEMVPDIGGGICQVSSTLYNLVLLTNLEIIERMNHSLPVSYVPLGRDATVNYGTIDLKFKNNTGGYLLLTAEVVEDNLTVKFFSKDKIDTSIELYSETIKTIPSPVTIKKDFNLTKGEVRIKQGASGYVVNLWKKYNNTENEQSVLISTDTYNPTPTFLYTGEKVVESQETDDTLDTLIQNEPPLI